MQGSPELPFLPWITTKKGPFDREASNVENGYLLDVISTSLFQTPPFFSELDLTTLEIATYNASYYVFVNSLSWNPFKLLFVVETSIISSSYSLNLELSFLMSPTKV